MAVAIRKGSSTSCCCRGVSHLLVGGYVLVLLLVADCCAKPLQSVGQDEVEEDTSQGNLKEQFPSHLLQSVGLMNMGGSGITSDSVAAENDEDGETWRSDNSAGDDFGRLNMGYSSSPGHLRKYHYLAGSVGGNGVDPRSSYKIEVPSYSDRGETSHPINSDGAVHKRSLGFVQIPSSSSYAGEEEGKRYASSYFPSQENSQAFATSSASFPQSDGSPSENAGFRMRQKLLNLRNQYGNNWLAFVSPYAYRKRQILYRQCFFNPISCF